MDEYKRREFDGDRKEFHLYFGQGTGLGRCYRVHETHWGSNNHKDYIYENDQEMEERYRRFEEIEYEEKMKKKYGQVGK